MSSLKICDECPVLAPTSRRHELEPRRPTVAVLRTVASKLSAKSLFRAASIMAARLVSSGLPGLSSSPVNIT
jgi:hypothetical protein